MKSQREQIAWAAGLFEGEGCVYMQRGKYAHLILSTTDEDVVRRFHRVMGCGVVYQQDDPRPNHKPVWHWRCWNRDDVENIYRLFAPWLGERRDEKFKVALRLDKRRYEKGVYRAKARATTLMKGA
jgi:hypothetical protein